ncbi:unnamed protein product [Hermetia illucens]|uniref:DAGKc domain-containing protein n=1 Tax=Hermetia illucens TaxID=343691 RepID=A0A7R8V8R6_HERIL|nr:ceramide kinase [Hermetia illucens]XP_037926163.1 ceramide kinase [Hermetia illucens]CAD7094183.1 unnamed protein product [Hermetia illucens]
MEDQQQDTLNTNHQQEEIKEKHDILLNTFLISNKKFRVLLHHGSLVWEKENSKNGKTTVPLIDILAVRLASSSNRNKSNNISSSRISINPSVSSLPTSAVPSTSSDTFDSSKNYLYIYYAKRDSNCQRDHNRWRKHTLKLYNTDYRIIQTWHNTLADWLDQQKRPKNILMFVNPYGGKRQALKIFEKYSKPLFQLAGVEISCLISQRGNQIHDILQNNPALYQYDAICCVGGDGTFAEVFNGLMQRTLRDLSLDPQRPTYLPKLRIPIGVIPAGSTDTVAYCLHGTTDVKTAVIHIILGQKRGLDLSSVCNHIGLIRLYASLICYGYLGDIALDSEQYRWMGPHRYDYSGFKKFIANRGYEIELAFPESESTKTQVDNLKTNSTCNIGCDRCLNQSEPDKCEQSHIIDYSILSSNLSSAVTPGTLESGTKDHQNWKTVRGKYFMVAGANISCASSRSPNGLAPFCHLGDGHIEIIVIRHTSMFNLLRLLIRLNRENPQLDMLPFVEIYRAKKFLVRSNKTANNSASSSDLTMGGSRQPISSSLSKGAERTSQWNCDGELVFDTDVLISSHRQLVDVFMRGSYPPSEEKKSSCCGLCGV